MPRPKKHVKHSQVGGTQPSNTSNNLANQQSNASNPPQPTELLKNQNLPNSAASAADLPILQQINCLP